MNHLDLEKRVRQLLSANPKIGRHEIARQLGVKPNGALRRILGIIKAGGGSSGPADESSETQEYSDNSAVLSTRRPNVRTLDDLLAYMKVDLTVWEVERHVINKWECVMREPATTVGGAGKNAEISIGKHGEKSTLWTRGSNRPLHEPLYQVKAWLKRKTPTIVESALERIIARLEKAPPKISRPIHRASKTRDGCLLELALYDAHFAMLAWAKETGNDYDLKIAEESFSVAADDLLEKTKGFRPEKIILPIGNDFLHVNNPEGLTPLSHNRLDVDGRLCKITAAGETALIKLIDRLRHIAPVTGLWIPGNHDPQTSYFLCRTLRAWFRNDKHVEIDVSPPTRKYFRYGCNLIGCTHGNEESHHDLPNIMAGERKQDWAECTCFEWHVGHRHKKKETRFNAADTFGNVVVRIIPPLTATDAWHFGKGYVNGLRLAEAFVYGKQSGLIGQFSSRDLRHNPPTFNSDARN